MTLERDPASGKVRRAKKTTVVAPVTIPTPAIVPGSNSALSPVSGQSFTGLDPFTQGLLEISPVIPVAPVEVVPPDVVAVPVVNAAPVVSQPNNNSRSLLFGLAAVAVGVFAVLLTRQGVPVKQPEFLLQAPTAPPAPVVPETGGWTS
jgi:hypothetical protein